MTLPLSILISINEAEIIKAILEFLENRHLHIAQVLLYIIINLKNSLPLNEKLAL